MILFISPRFVVKKGLNGMAMLMLSTMPDTYYNKLVVIRSKTLTNHRQRPYQPCFRESLHFSLPQPIADPSAAPTLPGGSSLGSSNTRMQLSWLPSVSDGNGVKNCPEIPEFRASRRPVQRIKDELAGRHGALNHPRNWTSALPVNLPPSFSIGVASLGRVGPRFLPVPSLYARFLYRSSLSPGAGRAVRWLAWEVVAGRLLGPREVRCAGAYGAVEDLETPYWSLVPIFRLRCSKGLFPADSTILIDFNPAKYLGFV